MRTLPAEKNFLGLDEIYSSIDKSEIVIVSIPYEGTVSYMSGAARGPQEIIKASQQVEFYDEEFNRELCFEAGIATLEPMDVSGMDGPAIRDISYNLVDRLIKDDKFVVTLGGEHSISLGPIKAHHDNYKNLSGGLSILHLDAHSDMRDSYLGNRFSHASVFARVAEFTTDITQLGIRAQSKEEAEFIKIKGIKTFYAYEVKNGNYSKNWIEEVISALSTNVYLSFDCDYFDPWVMPATGTPVPGGFGWDETIELFRQLTVKRKIVGFDITELAPLDGIVYPNFAVASLIYKLLNFIFRNK
ncbi:MAG: agmatinase [Candidatus Kryptoniota bacterium]